MEIDKHIISPLFQNASRATPKPQVSVQMCHDVRYDSQLLILTVWTRPEQQGAPIHLHLHLSFSLAVPLVVPSFSHSQTNEVFVTLLSASLTSSPSLLVFLNYLPVSLSPSRRSHVTRPSLLLPSLPQFFSCCFLSSTHSSTVFFNFLCMKDSSGSVNNK